MIEIPVRREQASACSSAVSIIRNVLGLDKEVLSRGCVSCREIGRGISGHFAVGSETHNILSSVFLDAREVSKDRYIVSFSMYGQKYAEENGVTVKPPIDIVGFQSLVDKGVYMYRDSDGKVFYVVFDAYANPPWRIETDKAKVGPLIREIKSAISSVVRKAVSLVKPPLAIYTAYTGHHVFSVSLEDKKKAVYDSAKHEAEWFSSSTSVWYPIVALSENEWRYVHLVRTVVSGDKATIYFFMYPENEL